MDEIGLNINHRRASTGNAAALKRDNKDISFCSSKLTASVFGFLFSVLINFQTIKAVLSLLSVSVFLTSAQLLQNGAAPVRPAGQKASFNPRLFEATAQTRMQKFKNTV